MGERRQVDRPGIAAQCLPLSDPPRGRVPGELLRTRTNPPPTRSAGEVARRERQHGLGDVPDHLRRRPRGEVAAGRPARVPHERAGALTVRLPGSDSWETFASGSQFTVPANSKFQLKVASDTAYLCEYR